LVRLVEKGREYENFLIDQPINLDICKVMKEAGRLPIDNRVFQAKPGPFKNVKKELDVLDMEERDRKSLEKLKEFKPEDVWGKERNLNSYSFLGNFKGKMPQYFILNVGRDKFLVNTEGYNYGRYVVKLSY